MPSPHPVALPLIREADQGFEFVTKVAGSC